MNYRQLVPFVVEDDDDFALLLERAFQKAGVPDGNVRRYRDGETALAALKSSDVVLPSVVTLDIELPGMSGLSVLRQIRSHKPFLDLPTFVLTGREDPGYVTEAYALRANGYWVKPSGPWEFQEIVTAILEFLRRPGAVRLPRCLPNPWTRY
jgi:CheY-like chemotaxis protein